MSTLSSGKFYSDLAIGEKEDVSEDLKILSPSDTPFANSFGAFTSSVVAENRLHQFLDDAYIANQTTLRVNMAVGALQIDTTEEVFKTGQKVEIDGEVITLGTRRGAHLWDCTRSTGTIAAAAHAALRPVTLVGKGAPEGAAAGGGDINREPRPKNNQVQTLHYVIDVSDIAKKARRYGRPGTKYDDDAKEMLKQAALEYESSALKGVKVTGVGSTGVGGEMEGIMETILGVGNSTNMAGTDFTMAKLRAAIKQIERYYGSFEDVNAVLLHPTNQSHIFNGWEQAHVVVAPGDPLVAQYGVQVRRLKIGKLTIDSIPTNILNATACMYLPPMIQAAWMEKIYHERLPRDGLSDRGQIAGTGTVECYCPESGWVFYGLNTA